MRRTRLIGIVLVAVLVLAGCGSLTPVTEQGREVRDLYNVLYAVAAVVFVLVEAAIVFAAIRYRRRSDMLPPQFHGNNLLEVVWTVVPLLIVAALFVLTWGVLNRVEAKADNPRVTVNVLAFQWQWQFTYQGERVPLPAGQPPEDLTIKGTIAKPPVMYLPVGEPIRFNAEAQDVIHSFYVREFLYKRDAFPDHTNTFDLTITEPGDYGGQCTEYCGLAHQAMRFTVRAVSRPEYDAWLEKAKREAASGCPDDPNPRSIAAKDIAFNKDCLAGPVNRPFEIEFENQEAVPHNVAFFQGRDASAPRILPQEETPVFPGPKTETYQLPALKAGAYYFHCDAHPGMSGELNVRSR
ncbi:MAG TPA: cytochrome c oxidase subunit II [Actinomycetes bacterium]|nr:cytochrome c oxidase subunit II [Actinomycetes bacterium]